MKTTCFLLIAVVLSLSVKGQEALKTITSSAKHIEAAPDTVKHWQFMGTGSLNFNQAYMVNWAAGGQSSLGLSTNLSLQANYKKGKNAWNNNLDLAYGFQLQAPGSGESQFRKTDDRIELNSFYGYGISKHWDLTVLVNLKTQFTSGYNYPDDSTVISKFMSPGYLITGIGFSWIPAKYFSLFLSPSSGRFTFVLDPELADSGSFGVARGKHIRGEFGPYLRAAFNKDLVKNINLNTTLDLFTNYLEEFGNIDVNWSLLLTIKANRWLSTIVSTTLIYDDKVKITDLQGKTGPRTQFKENLGIGIAYKIHQKGASK